MPGYCSNHSLVRVVFKTGENSTTHSFEIGVCKPGKTGYFRFEKTTTTTTTTKKQKQYVAPVYYRNDLHMIDDEELVLIINNQLFSEMILLKIRGSCISQASLKKKEQTILESEIMSSIQYFEDNFNENNVHQLERKRQELMELRKKKRRKEKKSREHDCYITCRMAL